MRLLATKILDFPFKQRLLMKDFSLVEYPFIRIKPLRYNPKKPTDAILVSSQNAARLFFDYHPIGTLSPKTQFFCVGSQTTKLIESRQGKVTVTALNAQELALRIIKEYSHLTFCFACGRKRLPTLETELAKANIALSLHELYDTHIVSHQLNTDFDGVLFYSPSAVEGFLTLNRLKNTHSFCIGPTTAAALEPHTSFYSVAKKPNNNSLFLEIMNHYYAKK